MALMISFFLIGVGLSMDAFAVSVCKGLAMRKVNKKQALVIGIFFGGFQALMPLIGYTLGVRFEKYITNIDHWIAFALLVFIGGNMIREALFGEEEDEITHMDPPLDFKELFVMAIATSIDALAVGVSLAVLRENIWVNAAWIGCVTFALSTLGVLAGRRLGRRMQRCATVAGGLVLIFIGAKILIEHLR